MGGIGGEQKKPPPQPSPTSLFCVPQNKEAGEGVFFLPPPLAGEGRGGGNWWRKKAPTPALPRIFILLAQNKDAGEGVKMR